MSAQIAASRFPWEAAALVRDELAIVVCNRSAAYFAAGDFIGALADADAVIQLKRPWSKGHFRKAKALLGLGLLEDARESAELGLQFEPDSKVCLTRAFMASCISLICLLSLSSCVGTKLVCCGDRYPDSESKLLTLDNCAQGLLYEHLLYDTTLSVSYTFIVHHPYLLHIHNLSTTIFVLTRSEFAFCSPYVLCKDAR